jgi:hypothetical protein
MKNQRSVQTKLRRRVTIWIVGSMIGGVLLVLPDSDQRVFSLSATHGPAVVDLVGMVLLVAVWLPIAALFLTERSLLVSRASGRWGLGLAGLGCVGLVVTLFLDARTLWVAPVVLLFVAQLVLLRTLAADASRVVTKDNN